MSGRRPSPTNKVVSIIGGTGPQGCGLAGRFEAEVLEVVVGSRSAERSVATALDLSGSTGGRVRGDDNLSTSAVGDIVPVVVPWEGHADLIRPLASGLIGKVVVDSVNPLGFDKLGTYDLAVVEGSATQQAADLLPDSTVVVPSTMSARPCSRTLKLRRSRRTCLFSGRIAKRPTLIQELADSVPGLRGVYGGRSECAPGRSANNKPDQHQSASQGPRSDPRHRCLTSRESRSIRG